MPCSELSVNSLFPFDFFPEIRQPTEDYRMHPLINSDIFGIHEPKYILRINVGAMHCLNERKQQRKSLAIGMQHECRNSV